MAKEGKIKIVELVAIVLVSMLLIIASAQSVVSKQTDVKTNIKTDNELAIGSSGRAEAASANLGTPQSFQITFLPEPSKVSPEKQKQREEILNRIHLPGPAVSQEKTPVGPSGDPVSAPEQAPGTFTLFKNSPLGAGAPDTEKATVNEPSAGSNGDYVFYTGNWYAARSTNGGSTFSYIDPYADMSDFCCDQDVIYDSTRDIFIWYRQGVPDSTGVNRFRLGISNDNGATWVFYDVLPTYINGGWTNQWWDYPHLALSSNYLYITSNMFNQFDSFTRTVILRFPLDALRDHAGVPVGYFDDSDHFTFTPVQGATNTIYWGTHNTNSNFRIYGWAESSPSVFWSDKDIAAWTSTPGGSASCPGPDGINWCARTDDRVTGGWLANGVIGFYWNVQEGGSFPYPYIESATFAESDRSYIGRPAIWATWAALQYGYAYPDKRGNRGVSAFYGGGSYYPSHQVLIYDDITPNGEAHWTNSGTNGATGWGDYVRVRPYYPSGKVWSATGYTLQGGSGRANVDPRYIEFGRERDAIVSLGEAVDNFALTWSTGGNAYWYGQTATSFYGGDAAQSDTVLDNQYTWVQTTVTGPGTLNFSWKVSSEPSYDYLRFYIDDVQQAAITGEFGWEQKNYSIGSGTHTLRWNYTKDGSVSLGSDAGWLDRVEFTPSSIPLGEAVDNTALSWTTGGNANWVGQDTVFYFGGDAAQSGRILDNQYNWIQTTVTGPGTLNFSWKVSSESGWDYLKVYIDGVILNQITGEYGWEQKSYSIGSGTHTVKWNYTKDGSVSLGSDAGWLDRVEFTPILNDIGGILLSAPASLSATGQVATLTAQLKDAAGINLALPGQTVTFASNNTTLAAVGIPSALTDASGVATSNITANALGLTGTVMINATVTNAAGTMTFTSTLIVLITTPGFINGTVTNNTSGLPIQGATVTAGGLTAITNSTGFYSIRLAPGTYTVNASATGFTAQSVPGVAVLSGATTIRNFALLPVLQPLYVSISESPDPVNSGGTSQVNVHVTTTGGVPVIDAGVIVSATGGTLNPISGSTDLNGDFRSNYTAPLLTSSSAKINMASENADAPVTAVNGFWKELAGYDFNSNSVIEKSEQVQAVLDFFNGTTTKQGAGANIESAGVANGTVNRSFSSSTVVRGGTLTVTMTPGTDANGRTVGLFYRVIETLPTGVTFVSSTADGVAQSGQVVDFIMLVPPGEIGQFTYTVTVSPTVANGEILTFSGVFQDDYATYGTVTGAAQVTVGNSTTYTICATATKTGFNPNSSCDAITVNSSTNNVVSIQDVSTLPGSVQRVPIIIHNSTGVASVGLRLSYNASVVLAYSDPALDKGDFTDFYAADNSNNASGWITINAMKFAAGSSKPLALPGNPVVGYVRLRAVGSSGSSSALSLSDIVLTDDLGNDVPYTVRNGTFTIISDAAPPIVTNPTTNQSVIPDDTDYIPLWGETAHLSVTVTDDSGVAGVTINLSEIGGPAAKTMTPIGSNVYSTTTNASAGTPPKLYNLTVTATDTFGNPNTSVSIQLKVMRNGDCTGNGLVNIGDALRLANNVSYPGNPAYALSSPYVCEVTGNGAINIGDALRLANNVSYPGNPAYMLK